MRMNRPAIATAVTVQASGVMTKCYHQHETESPIPKPDLPDGALNRTPGRSSSRLRRRPAVRTTRDPEQAEAGRGFNRWTAAGIAGGVGAWVYGAGMVVDFGDRPGRIFTSGLIGTLTTALAANQTGANFGLPEPRKTALPPLGAATLCSPWRKSAFRDRQGGSHVLHWQAWRWARRVAAIAKVAKMKGGSTRMAHKMEHAVDLETGAVLVVTIQGRTRGIRRRWPRPW